MKQSAQQIIDLYRGIQEKSILVGNVLVILMMLTLAIGFIQVFERLFPEWNTGYWVWISLLISLESIYARKQTRALELREKIFFRVSEWIAFAILIKIALYVVNGPAQILQDIPRWQENFFDNFFTGEYLVALMVATLVWWNSSGYASELDELYDREMETGWEVLGKLANAMNDIRKRINSRVFLLGALLVFLAILSRIDMTALLRSEGVRPEGYAAPVANVLAYFTCALVLLSQTQFALLRTRWHWQRLPINGKLAVNWVRYGLAFFVALAIIAFLLPTEYSLGLFDTLRYALAYLYQALALLFFLVTLPFTLCMSLFSLANRETTNRPNQQFSPPPPAVGGSEPIAWLEFLRSLVFWIIFLSIIFFALRYYLSQNTALWNAIINFPVFRWARGAWSDLWSWLKGANRQITGLVRSGVRRLRTPKVRLPVEAVRRAFNTQRMTPREKIVFFYLSLVQMGGERGLSRKPSQTPYQYEQRLSTVLPDVDNELHGLTDTFLEARYSQHPLDEPEANQAGSLWERIRAVLRSWRKPEK